MFEADLEAEIKQLKKTLKAFAAIFKLIAARISEIF